jgi:hypothetical protein
MLPKGTGSESLSAVDLKEVAKDTSCAFIRLVMRGEQSIYVKRKDGKIRACLVRMNDLQVGTQTLFIICLEGKRSAGGSPCRTSLVEPSMRLTTHAPTRSTTDQTDAQESMEINRKVSPRPLVAYGSCRRHEECASLTMVFSP